MKAWTLNSPTQSPGDLQHSREQTRDVGAIGTLTDNVQQKDKDEEDKEDDLGRGTMPGPSLAPLSSSTSVWLDPRCTSAALLWGLCLCVFCVLSCVNSEA